MIYGSISKLTVEVLQMSSLVISRNTVLLKEDVQVVEVVLNGFDLCVIFIKCAFHYCNLYTKPFLLYTKPFFFQQGILCFVIRNASHCWVVVISVIYHFISPKMFVMDDGALIIIKNILQWECM